MSAWASATSRWACAWRSAGRFASAWASASASEIVCRGATSAAAGTVTSSPRRPRHLLMAQGLDRIQARGAVLRVDAEDQADEAGEAEREERRVRADDER